MGLLSSGTQIPLAFNEPSGLALSSNMLYISDQHGISVIDVSGAPYRGRRVCGGTVSGFQDGTNPSFNTPMSLTVDGDGNLYVADRANFRIRKITFSN
jgi:hypothetical protein